MRHTLRILSCYYIVSNRYFSSTKIWEAEGKYVLDMQSISQDRFTEGMEWATFFVILFIWCDVIGASTRCVSRYTTRPIDGYSCQSEVHKNVSDVHFHRCIHACIGSKTCWSLSYSRPGRYCLLAEEPCVVTNPTDDFSMMILRMNEPQHCIQWIPFNSTYGLQHGFPKRAVQADLSMNRKSAVTRAANSAGTLVGRSISDNYQANLLDSSQANINLDHGYEILVVGDTCSTAWVPYTTGDPIPLRGCVAGKDSLNRNYYVVGREASYLHIGGYIEGEVDAYYSNTYGTGSNSFRNMFMLIALH